MLTCALTFPLLFLGGLVTSYDVGMAVPDWPTTFEQNMLTFPFLDKPMGVKIEHLHRLLGVAVGCAAIALVVAANLLESRLWVRGLAWAVLAAVIVQGVLGGLRVRLNAAAGRELAMAHGIFGQATFATMVLLVVVLGKKWATAPRSSAAETGRVRLASGLLATLLYVQMGFGALLRHLGAGLAVHLILAGSITLLAMYLVLLVAVNDDLRPALLWPASGMFFLLLVQVFLGLGALVLTGAAPPGLGSPPTNIEAFTATAHQAAGALVFASSIVLVVASFRRLAPLSVPAAADAARQAPRSVGAPG